MGAEKTVGKERAPQVYIHTTYLTYGAVCARLVRCGPCGSAGPEGTVPPANAEMAGQSATVRSEFRDKPSEPGSVVPDLAGAVMLKPQARTQLLSVMLHEQTVLTVISRTTPVQRQLGGQCVDGRHPG